MIIWITGISGSGKTTIASRLIKKYKNDIKNLVNVDGDVIRGLYDNDLNYDLDSRITQIKRIQKVCLFLENQGFLRLFRNVARYHDPWGRWSKFFVR